MTRGTLYEFQENMEDVGTAAESDFYAYLNHEFSNIEKLNPAKAKVIIDDLLYYFRRLGMETGSIVDSKEDREFPYMEITENGKKAYFRQAYKDFKKLAAECTMKDFLDETKAYELRQLVDDTYANAVTTINDEFRTFDDFMRSASGRYYIGNVFYMK